MSDSLEHTPAAIRAAQDCWPADDPPADVDHASLQTLIDLLEWRACHQPDRTALIFLGDGEQESERLSYRALQQQARAMGQVLSAHGAAGARVLLCYPPGLAYVVAFFGCLYAGMTAVPAYPPEPDRSSRTQPRLQAIIANSAPQLGLTTPELLPTMQAMVSGPAWLAPDPSAAPAAPDWQPAPQHATQLAFLMYTSGSTSTPKGVMVSHQQVLSNLGLFAGFAERPCRSMVSWLPLFHDLGLLFGVLHPLYQGALAVLMPPLAFAQRPFRWLAAISHYRASTSGAPNFAYDLCVRKTSPAQRASLDLSHWTMALNGAEPVRLQTIDAFSAAFGPCGFQRAAFYPSYGLADATATVSGGVAFVAPTVYTFDRAALEQRRVRPGQGVGERQRTLVSCGVALPQHTLQIVDPETLQPCGPGRVGEIWVAGPSIGLGYWDRPGESQAAFHARLAERPTERFLRTGDLGFVYQGELFISGRLKDLVIIQGRNHAPEDLELTIGQCHPALRPGGAAAFSLEGEHAELLAVVQEVQPDLDDRGALIDCIRQALVLQHDVAPSVIVLVAPASLPKTSSGKLQRHRVRQLLLEGQITVLERWQAAPVVAPGEAAPQALAARRVAAEPIQQWLTRALAQRLGLPAMTIAPDQPFSRYGLASAEAVGLVADLEEWLDLHLSPTLLWQYPTIAALAGYLAGEARVLPAEAPPTAPVEPIAIVGMGCRFPGAASPSQLWQLLAEGRDVIGAVPPERWDSQALFDPRPDTPGTMITRWGGFLERLEWFDAQFFGISPREAPHLDPRQRLLLECTWEALEDAGIPPDQLANSRTGVFVAVLSNDYDQLLFDDLSRVDAYSGPGTANSIVANRISYVLDTRGPSIALDTACSGSLVAIHLACQSLRSGESSMALAGGVGINLMPRGNVFFTKAGALSPDGHCKTFDARANGIVRSDGCGVVVLKRLGDALRDGDPIAALICGSAVNSDGRSNGIMAPNRMAQEAVLRDAYRQAGCAPSQVQYVEAHGTGTPLGDPIEMQALASVLGADRAPSQICAVGSIKTNLGHTEPAAGVAGVIKTALALKHRLLPPSLHYQQPNPLIPFAEIPFQVQRALGPWPRPQEPLLAGVSGFGFGGTNAHVVLAAPPAPPVAPPLPAQDHHQLLTISARSPAALRASAESYRQALLASDAAALRDICYSAGLRRSHHDHRLALAVQSHAEAAEHLDAFLRGEERPGLTSGSVVGRQSPRVVMVFSGQGSHWLGMGRYLWEHEPVARAVLERCDQALRPHVDWSLQQALCDEERQLQTTDLTQPAIVAVQLALAALWRSWGVQPSVMLGQSLGEVAAACAAGALCLEDALLVAVLRSRLMMRVAGQGRTAVVGLTLEQSQLALAGHEDVLGVAGSNSPHTSVLSGEPARLAMLLESLERSGVFCRMLRDVDIAFHSPQMDPLRDELEAALAGITPQETRVPLVSCVTAAPIAGTQLDAHYWGRNLREPFRFAEALAQLLVDGTTILLEVSPHPVLASSMQELLRETGRQGVVLASLRRDSAARASLLGSLGALYCQGLPIHHAALYPLGGRCVALPNYPWQPERYWFDQLSSLPGTGAHRGGRVGHPLLGQALDLALLPDGRVWQQVVSAHAPAYLSDHRVAGTLVFPGAAYVAMALEAAQQHHPAGALALAQVAFHQALRLPEQEARRLQLALCPAADGQLAFTIYSAAATDAASWQRHASGTLAPAPELAPPLALAQIQARCTAPVSASAHYAAMQARGLAYGPAFQAVTQIWRRDHEVLAQLELPTQLQHEAARYQIHPSLLDAGFQCVAAALPSDPHGAAEMVLPAGLAHIQVTRQPATPVWCHITLHADDSQAQVYEADLVFADQTGQVWAVVRRLRLQRLSGAAQPAATIDDWFHTISWQPHQLPALVAAPPPGGWLILADAGGVAERLAHQLERHGQQCVLVRPGPAYQHTPEGYRIDPARPADFRLLCADLAAQPPLQGVVYLWGLDEPPLDAVGAVELERSQQRLTAVLTLVQVLAQQDWPQPPRLWLITCGSQPVGEQPGLLAALQAPLWGLGRVVALEQPERWGGLVDLDPDCAPDDLAQLAATLLAPTPETQLAFRQGVCYVPRLAPAALASSPPLRLRPDASYLITGGLGGLGLLVARWLATQGARWLVLMARTPLPPRVAWRSIPAESAIGQQISAIHSLEALGTHVHVAACDIADQEALACFLADYRNDGWPPLRGVIHAAGVLQDQLLHGMTASQLTSVLRPKLLGAWLLHHAFANQPLDFLVLFSSLAAVLGQYGQANYAAGNAFMDALAHLRQAQGRPALSINWGAWAEVGMAAQLGQSDHFSRMGIQLIAPEQGLAALARLFGQPGLAQVVAVPADWRQVRRVHRAATILGSDHALVDAAEAAEQPSLLRQLQSCSEPAARRAQLQEAIHQLAARAMRLDPARLDPQQPLNLMGMDSIIAIEITNRVSEQLGVRVAVAELLMGAGVAQLVEQIMPQLEQHSAIADLVTEIDQLSDDQTEALLAALAGSAYDAAPETICAPE